MSRYNGVAILWIFVSLVFAFAFLRGDRYPIHIIGGEDSVGSWVSGTLLIISSTLSAVIASNRKRVLWLLFSMFFMLLAIDENFMIHEELKRIIVFGNYKRAGEPLYWLGELPVVIAAVFGALVAWVLWRNTNRSYRWLIILAVIFGTASVVLDVTHSRVLWEDSLKLLGELCVTSLVVLEFQNKG